MNYEVMCFDFVEDSLQVVQKEYFEDYDDALLYKLNNEELYCGISITPMNIDAENEIKKRG